MMRTYFKILLLGVLLSVFTYAEELFIHEEGLNLASISLSDTYCKTINASQQHCETKKLSYIDYDDAQLPSFLHGLKTHIEPIVLAYKSDDIKQSTLANIETMGESIFGEWDSQSTITLFAKTPLTYTLSTASSGYEGGAHGYQNQFFDNYDIKTNTKLSLDALFKDDYNQTLHTTAQAHYKASMGLRPNQPLTDDGWFEDSFILASNFAITPRGLYFFYNPYEIKSYASGPTEFMLPYSKIRNLINPDGALGFALKMTQPFHAYYETKDEISIQINSEVLPDKKVKITAKMKNLSYLTQGWLSLSFPQLSNKSNEDTFNQQGFTQLSVYPKGSKIYNQEHKKAIQSSYLLVEARDTNWDLDKTNTMTLILTPPTNEEQLILDIRGNFKSKDKSIMLPSEYDGIKGQQGFTNYRVFIDL